MRAVLTMLLWQDAYAVLNTRGATDDAQPGIDTTSVVTALSFWDYSLLTTVRMIARLICMSPAETCITGVTVMCYLGVQSAGSDAFKTTGRCFSVAAGRIAYTYALKGAFHSKNWTCGHKKAGCDSHTCQPQGRLWQWTQRAHRR